MKIDLNQAMKEKSATTGGGHAVAAGKGSKNDGDAWQPIRLTREFDLNQAVNKAYGRAEVYVNKLLDENDLYVQVDGEEIERVGTVRQKDTEAPVKTYDGVEMLRLFAHNRMGRGIIINGQV